MQHLVTASFSYMVGSKFTVVKKPPKLQPFNLISNYPKWHFTIILGSCTIRKMSLHQLISSMQSIFLCSARSYRTNDLLAEQVPWTLSVWGTAWEEIWEAPGQNLSVCSSDRSKLCMAQPLLSPKLDSSFVLQIDPKNQPFLLFSTDCSWSTQPQPGVCGAF